jgi:hypothetical protein
MVLGSRIPLLLAAFALVLGPAACADDGPDRAAVVAQIRSDPRMADTPSGVVDCLADWYMTRASEAERTAFVAGKPPPDEANAERETAVLECLKGAT